VAVRVSTRVEGLSKLVRQLEELSGDVEDVKDTMARIAKLGAQYASSFAPKLSGALASSIRGNRAKARAVVTAGRAAVPWAGPQNYGWPARNIPATSFMQRADTKLQPKALDLLDEGLRKAIRSRGLD
jgi:hypothetical protein